MIKAIAGNILVIGLSHRNLDIFEAEPNDTYIRIKKEDMLPSRLPFDIIIGSGDSFRAKGRDGTFIISLGMSELKNLRRKGLIDLKKEFYKIPINITIFGGETEATMASDLAELIGPRTKIITDPLLKN